MSDHREHKELAHIPRHFWPFSGEHFPFVLTEDDFFGSHLSSHSGLSISEDKTHVYVEASLPGLNPENIEVSLDNGVLWIKGEKREEDKDKNRKYYRKASSSFSYRVPVPGEIDLKKDPEATYKDGIMKVAFTKSESSHPKKIQIKQK